METELVATKAPPNWNHSCRHPNRTHRAWEVWTQVLINHPIGMWLFATQGGRFPHSDNPVSQDLTGSRRVSALRLQAPAA